MTLKRTDLEKMKALKIAEDLKGENRPDRFGKDSSGNSAKNAPKGLMGALLKQHTAAKADTKK